MPRFTLKLNLFPSTTLETPWMCVENPQNSAGFSETIDMRGHMPRLYCANECDPIYLMRYPR